MVSLAYGWARWDTGWGGKLGSFWPGEPDHLDAFQQGISVQVAAQSHGECLEPCSSLSCSLWPGSDVFSELMPLRHTPAWFMWTLDWVRSVKEGSVTASSCFHLVDPVCFIHRPSSAIVITLFVLERVAFSIFVLSQKMVLLFYFHHDFFHRC